MKRYVISELTELLNKCNTDVLYVSNSLYNDYKDLLKEFNSNDDCLIKNYYFNGYKVLPFN